MVFPLSCSLYLADHLVIMWHAVDDASRSRQVNFAQVSVGSSLLVVMRKIWLPEQLISASNFSTQWRFAFSVSSHNTLGKFVTATSGQVLRLQDSNSVRTGLRHPLNSLCEQQRLGRESSTTRSDALVFDTSVLSMNPRVGEDIIEKTPAKR